MKTLVIFGERNDPHTARVSTLLAEEGIKTTYISPIHDGTLPSLVFDPSDPDICNLSFPEFVSLDMLTLQNNDVVLWDRDKVFLDNLETTEEQEYYYTQKERREFLKGAATVCNWYVLNNAFKLPINNNKIFQLFRAKKLGLTIPNTIVTNSRNELLKFLDRNPNSIIKPLKTGFVPRVSTDEDSMLFMTEKLSHEDVENASETELAYAPIIAQNNIDKQHEIRLTFFRNDGHAAKVDSQKTETGLTDWRHAQFEEMFSDIPLDITLKKACSAYLKDLKLDYGAFDFIINQAGEPIFLECNTDGQWAWLDTKKNGFVISNIFAKNIKEILCS